VAWLPVGEKKFADTITRFDRIHEHDGQIDRQMDTQTPRDGIARAYA